MKALESKINSSNLHQQEKKQNPFFTKNRQGAFFQPKLTIGQPNDKYEQEADSMADTVVQKLQEPNIQTKCEDCEKEEGIQKMEASEKDERIQEKSASESSSTSPDLQTDLYASKGGGRQLPPNVSTSMGNAFGADFSDVKIHTDSTAVQMNQNLGAQAFTHGSDIYFNEGKYNAEDTEGQRLLAHELTHTIQQNGGKNQVQKTAANQRGRTSAYEVGDAITNLELAVSVAEDSIRSGAVPTANRSAVDILLIKVRSVLIQLYTARGTDGSGVTIGFDTNPLLNEINVGDARKPVEDLYYPFSVSSRRSRQLPPRQSAAPIVQAKLINNISTTSGPVVQRFCDPLICLGIIVLGGLLLSGCSRSSSGTIGPARLRQAKANFDTNNTGLTQAERRKIHTAMAATVGSNDALLISFYDYYSNKDIIKASGATLTTWPTGQYAETQPNSDTIVHPSILASGYSDSKLGGLLIHEFTHTRHHTNFAGSRDYEEGDSYGIEYFFAERNGNSQRETEIIVIMNNLNTIATRAQHPVLRSHFCKSYGTMKVLYEIIDNGTSSHTGSPLASVTRDQARAFSADMASKREESHSAELTAITTWVNANKSTVGMPRLIRCN